MRKDKQEWLEEKCTEVEEMYRRHNTSGVYKTIKEITEKKGMRQMGIKDKDGKILTDGEQVLNRWKTCDGQPGRVLFTFRVIQASSIPCRCRHKVPVRFGFYVVSSFV